MTALESYKKFYGLQRRQMSGSKAVIAEWHQELHYLLTSIIGGDPVSNERLRKNVARSKHNVDAHKGLDGKVPPKKARSDVNAGILGEMKQALKNLSKHSPSNY